MLQLLPMLQPTVLARRVMLPQQGAVPLLQPWVLLAVPLVLVRLPVAVVVVLPRSLVRA
jgi:hypothetical protein